MSAISLGQNTCDVKKNAFPKLVLLFLPHLGMSLGKSNGIPATIVVHADIMRLGRGQATPVA